VVQQLKVALSLFLVEERVLSLQSIKIKATSTFGIHFCPEFAKGGMCVETLRVRFGCSQEVVESPQAVQG
jgi:hypothetical protein